jgi:alkylated DNA repair dioxygenase AlkB
MSNTKAYFNQQHQHKYQLQEGAIVVHRPMYVKNPSDLFSELKKNIEWDKFKYNVYDKIVDSPRLMNIIHWNDNTNNTDLPNLYQIKKSIEELTNTHFNYAVLNYYRDGKDYISYHSDREVADGQIVASVSVGATRRFVLKNIKNGGLKHTLNLGHGDLIILNTEAISTRYKHSVPKMANVGARINITFRE